MIGLNNTQKIRLLSLFTNGAKRILNMDDWRKRKMTDKERLEQIKNRDIKYLLGGTQLAEDWEWLIYQARKVIELEKTIELYHFWYSKAYEQNKNLKHILKFYADEEKMEKKHVKHWREIND